MVEQNFDVHPDDAGTPLGSAPAAAVAMLQEHLTEVTNEATTVNVVDYEDKPDNEVNALVTRARGMLLTALEALDVVELLYCDDDVDQPDEGDWADFEENPFNAEPPTSRPPPSSSLEVQDIVSTVMVARMSLRRKQNALVALGERSTTGERLVAACDVFRSIPKALGAVDSAMATAERVPMSIDFHRRAIAQSLEVRRTYVRFYHAVMKGAAPPPEKLYGRLRSCGNAIAAIFGRPVASRLWIADRALLMMSQTRIRDWLAQWSDAPEDGLIGMRIWQDVANIATMFLEVSKREELVRYDAMVVRDALQNCGLLFEQSDEKETERQALLSGLLSIQGRSLLLDSILAEPIVSENAEALTRALRDLDRQLQSMLGVAEYDVSPFAELRSRTSSRPSFD